MTGKEFKQKLISIPDDHEIRIGIVDGQTNPDIDLDSIQIIQNQNGSMTMLWLTPEKNDD